ncbi:MAG TPA: hypothetical protein PKY99_00110 [Turneriella sp.]|nr:hypothetical protein [Turneriella sp.]
MQFNYMKKVALDDAMLEKAKKFGRENVKAIYTDGFVVVQEYHLHWRPRFKKILVRHLAISHRDGIRLNKFYDIMALKDLICGEDCEAVQVYPRRNEVVDAADMLHLFVFPRGFKWPLTLRRKW